MSSAVSGSLDGSIVVWAAFRMRLLTRLRRKQASSARGVTARAQTFHCCPRGQRAASFVAPMSRQLFQMPTTSFYPWFYRTQPLCPYD